MEVDVDVEVKVKVKLEVVTYTHPLDHTPVDHTHPPLTTPTPDECLNYPLNE